MDGNKMVENMALALQQDCQQTVENIMVQTGIPETHPEIEEKIREGQHCWVLKKMAEYEIRLQQIESFLQL